MCVCVCVCVCRYTYVGLQSRLKKGRQRVESASKGKCPIIAQQRVHVYRRVYVQMYIEYESSDSSRLISYPRHELDSPPLRQTRVWLYTLAPRVV